MQEKVNELKLDDIYERIGDLANARRNKKTGEYLKVDIAKALNVKPQDISNWAFRGTFPWMELFLFSQREKIPFDSLLTGKIPKGCLFCGKMDEKTKKACRSIDEILKSSNESIKPLTTVILAAIEQYEKTKKKPESPTIKKRKRHSSGSGT
jgi:hypothetical protein